ncbi:hypothetical protein BHQ15_00615 [Mycolicibacillus koreensis]|nr:hypothetical protein BHQ15_00615 [Mycolicibacillus koreensis]
MSESAADWDERYAAAEQLFSGEPNATLVRDVESLPAGRALDVGCGEGADAVWLATQGWTVTGLDVSAVALQRAGRCAEAAGVDVSWVRSGLAEAQLPSGGFDLVSAHYPALPSSAERRAEHALAAAVAPGGMLLAVFHAGFDGAAAAAHGIDPADYVQAADVLIALLAGDWQVHLDTHRRRDTPLGDGSHAADVVVRARRTG